MLLDRMRDDFRAVAANDPAAKNPLETLMCHTPLHAIWAYRVAHALQGRFRVPLVPRLLSTLARFWTGVEIHPGAEIGRGFFIDHGAGVVIGETAKIGADCVLFHGVTLGGTGHHRGQRHPILGDRVLVGTGATLLGPIRVGSEVKIGANSFIIMRDVPPRTTVVGVPARIVKRDGHAVDEELPETPNPVGA